MTALPPLLCLFWMASTSTYILKPFSPHLSHILTYGKTASTADIRGWGPGRIPTYMAWRSFYLLGVATWTFALLYPLSPLTLPLSLVGLHLVRRVVETWFVHIYSPAHVAAIHVFAGSAYYVAMPLTVAVAASPPPSSPSTVGMGLGLVLFTLGSALQSWTHLCLRWARTHNNNDNEKKEKKNKYVRLEGGVFDVWASPHYVGEVVLYLGLWVVMGGGGWVGTSMVVFVCVNLWDKASAASRFAAHSSSQ